jgi:uncharacterized surface protein with fasciclin (FAS1) repeats
MLGNFDENEWIRATPDKKFSNGQVFRINKMLQYSRRNTLPDVVEGYKSQDLATYILNMATSSNTPDNPSGNPNVTTFKSYVVQCLMGDGSNELAGVSADNVLTIFMPTNAAMDKAVANGDLPSYKLIQDGDVPSRVKATKFLLYHMLKGKVFVDDGLTYIMPNKELKRVEDWPTALKDVVDNTYLSVWKDATGKLMVSTKSQSTGKAYSTSIKSATVTRGYRRSNFFGAKAVLHEINDYLVYNKVQ